MPIPPETPLAEMAKLPLATTACWASPSVADRVRTRWAFPILPPFKLPPPEIQTLIAIGGGAFLDQAKWHRRHEFPGVRLIAVPSIWGSGAEASRVCVRDVDGKKAIELDDALTPDAHAFWPELAESIPFDRREEAFGDVWAHAYESFLCPLTSEPLLAEASNLLRELQSADTQDPLTCFRLSARACALQAASGVGLIHGIAHVLEGVLRKTDPGGEWHHARLCNLLLWPVHRFNRTHSSKVADRAAQTGFDAATLDDTFRARFKPELYARLVPMLSPHWMDILRDRCTRMNGVLARPAHLDFFTNTDFENAS
jgi:alcohol dehydrogenase class IV